MGFRKSWDTADVARQIHSLARECSSTYNDGFTSFECKKDLYQLKQIVDDALAEAPDFGLMLLIFKFVYFSFNSSFFLQF
jgi:hypothetical protein